MKISLLILLPLIISMSCTTTYEAKNNLEVEEYEGLLVDLAPYVNKKPKKATFLERFDEKNKTYYQLLISEQESELKFYSKMDTLHYFFYVNKDLTSLFEHYRGNGGYFVTDESGSINHLEILYYTPRWTKEEVKKKGKELFRQMVSNGNVNPFIGNKEYVHTPNEDFYYNVSENKWDYTPNSSWKFLETSEVR